MPPPVPQLLSDGALQIVPAQQPPEHDVASQMHDPFWQRCPLVQTGPPPHSQAPSTEQASASVGLQATQTTPPLPQLCSAGA